jgi:hypothetical protein
VEKTGQLHIKSCSLNECEKNIGPCPSKYPSRFLKGPYGRGPHGAERSIDSPHAYLDDLPLLRERLDRLEGLLDEAQRRPAPSDGLVKGSIERIYPDVQTLGYPGVGGRKVIT